LKLGSIRASRLGRVPWGFASGNDSPALIARADTDDSGAVNVFAADNPDDPPPPFAAAAADGAAAFGAT